MTTKASIPSLLNCTLEEIAGSLDSDTITSVQLVKAYLARIEEVDYEFNSVIETNPDALSVAAELDVERSISGRRSVLHGVPILLKDNIVTLDSMEATCGSYALVGAKPAEESAVVTILRKAGAIILGKANLAEWAGFRSTSGCSGWSARGGQSRGIYHPGMKASGSSSGSAISTALGLSFASIGTETGFSIVSPAEKSGVVGFKPTRGLIPSDGIIYASQRLDTLGLLTRTVQDADYMLHEFKNWSDPSITTADGGRLFPGPLSVGACFGTNLSGVRIGIPYKFLGEASKVIGHRLAAFGKIITLLEKAGAKIVWDVDIEGADVYQALPIESKDMGLLTHLKAATNTYLSGLKENPRDLKTLQDVIDFTKLCEAEEYPERNVAVLERAQATDPGKHSSKVMQEKDAYFAGVGGIPGTLDRYKLDVLLMPTLSVTIQAFAAKAGSPVISVPMGCYPAGTTIERDPNNGLITVAPNIPFSVYIYGRPQADLDVLRVAYVVEQLGEAREELKPYRIPQRDLVDFVMQ